MARQAQFNPAIWRARELQSPFDRRSLPVYLLIGIIAMAGLTVCIVLDFSISPRIFPHFFGLPLFAILAGWGLRRLGYPDLGGAMEALGLTFVQGLAAFLLVAPLAAISLPLADNLLASADRALGFDWVRYAKIVHGEFFYFCYHSFDAQPLIVALAVFLSGQADRAWRFVLSAVIAVGLSALIFPFVPAVGPSLHYGFDVPGGLRPFAPILLELKDGHRELGNWVFVGLISFPSYHATAAVLYSWACWTTKLRWPVLLLNILMAASAITIGSHYLVDIIGGAIIGAFAIWLAGRRIFDSITSPSRRRREDAKRAS